MATIVTVLMSVYNSERYLREAIESILSQSFTNFEFLIINDASTDHSVAIMESYTDPRIKIIHNEQNLGLTKSLNKGLRLANGKYVARMDADDISLPQRLEKQLNFMEANPEIGICGTWFQFMEQGKVIQHPISHKAIVTCLFKSNAIGHPTSILRKEIIAKNNLYYNEDFWASQDYELWVRASYVTQLANIPEVLLLYRKHSDQVSTIKLQEQKQFAFEAKYPLIDELLKGQKVNLQQIKLYKELLISKHRFSNKEIRDIVQLLNECITANDNKNLLEPGKFIPILLGYYKRLCRRMLKYNLANFYLIKSSPLYKYLDYKFKLKLFLKSLSGFLNAL